MPLATGHSSSAPMWSSSARTLCNSGDLMKSLINLAHEILEQQDKVDMLQAEHRFAEALTFASYDEIVGMLDVVLREDYVGFPVWARNLAYRLACPCSGCTPSMPRIKPGWFLHCSRSGALSLTTVAISAR